MEGPRKKQVTEQKILEAILNSSESEMDFEDSGGRCHITPAPGDQFAGMKVFFHLTDISLWNACWIYNKINIDNPLTLLAFREKIIKSYLAETPRERSSREATASTTAAGHFPDVSSSRKRCRQCSKNKNRTATKYICGVCRDKEGDIIGLCPYTCFKIWHNQ